mmetsp:Transcript_111033/g.220877  ORF Transcript_111033/g.220877 Transcript_111033/m.220877 type:complete len:455 (+) Transcript_111033:153-1517(+)|eukprot:CAMPEP_0172683772 /NCGR_PEP_ID=MMETSP1074-20121228/19083_1 /TAXON_ID=2916 /ORGANISM="Ceratium fusus, Strain PA161109" /LENGTH=454 /DNA_ID=CAMNT_0013502669 /DNA_START=70 /DNA_END=1434 /DNA_ORIENTATION=+
MQPATLGRTRDHTERPSARPEPGNLADVSCCTQVLYYVVLFLAYWFGSSRFDYNKDGTFDPTDVAHALDDFWGVATNNLKKRKGRQGNAHSGSNSNKNSSDIIANEEFVAGKTGKHQGVGNGELMDDMDDLRLETVEDHVADRVYQSIPIFILLQIFIVLTAWLIGWIHLVLNDSDVTVTRWTGKAGLDSISPGWSDLRLFGEDCQDLRAEVWRYITYQWSHVGISHVLVNCFMLIMLGIPLEGLNGFLRIMLMFNIGVFGGACCYWVGDAYRIVVGMSGGCYALVGMHVGNLILNWAQMKFRLACLVTLALLISIDISTYVISVGEENASHSAHVGGAIAGFLVSLIVGKNLKVLRWERCLQFFAAFVGVALLIFCCTWLALHDPPKHMFADHSWCWLRQVYSPKRFGKKWQCVQCANKACMESYSDVPSNQMLKVALSKCRDIFFEGTYLQN